MEDLLGCLAEDPVRMVRMFLVQVEGNFGCQLEEGDLQGMAG